MGPLRCTIIPDKSGPESNGNGKVHYTPNSSRTDASQSDAFKCHTLDAPIYIYIYIYTYYGWESYSFAKETVLHLADLVERFDTRV